MASFVSSFSISGLSNPIAFLLPPSGVYFPSLIAAAEIYFNELTIDVGM